MIQQISAEDFQKLEDKHGELYEARTGQGVLLFICPPEDVWHFFERGVGDDDQGKPKPLAEIREATHKLVARCVVYPERDALQSLLKKKPAIIGVIARQIGEVAKGSEESRAKKPETPSTEPATI